MKHLGVSAEGWKAGSVQEKKLGAGYVHDLVEM
jgi:hypothetical protein